MATYCCTRCSVEVEEEEDEEPIHLCENCGGYEYTRVRFRGVHPIGAGNAAMVPYQTNEVDRYKRFLFDDA